jgi:hypothetical protein
VAAACRSLQIMTMGGEFDKNTKANSGVLLINVTALAQHYYGLVRCGGQ